MALNPQPPYLNPKRGTLISHGSLTCWNCTAGQRGWVCEELQTQFFEGL